MLVYFPGFGFSELIRVFVTESVCKKPGRITSNTINQPVKSVLHILTAKDAITSFLCHLLLEK